MIRLPKCLAMVFILFAMGCATMIAPKEETLSLSGRYHDVIKLIEAKEAKGEDLSLRERYRLCEAYLQAPVFKKLFPCVDKLECQLEAESDHMLFSGVGLVTSMPWVLRARAYLELGKTDQAIQEAEKAYRIAKEASSGYDTNRFTALALLAFAHEKKGKHQQAESYLDRLEKETVSFLGWGVQIIEKRKAKTFAYFSLKRYHQFLEPGDEDAAQFLISLAFLTGDTPLTYSYVFPVRFALAKAKYETGQQEKALEIYNELLSHPQINQSGSIYWQILYDIGRHFLRLRKTEEGINILKKAISCIEEKRSTIDIEAGKIGFVGDKQQVYKDLIAALFEQGLFEEAFEYVERGKARALVDMLAAKKQFLGGGVDRVKTASLLKELEEAETKSIYLDYQDGSFEKRAITRGLKVTKVDQIARISPQLSSLVTVRSLDAKRIRGLLANDETLVEYYYQGDCVFAFVITQGSVHGIKLKGEGLNSEISKFRKQIMNPGSNQFKEHGKNLYEKLFQPFEAMLATQNLTIVPHGMLHYLSFNSLCSKDGYLIDRYNIRVLPSASVMEFLSIPREGQAGELIVFGNPDLEDRRLDLPFAEEESLAITKGQPNSKVLIRRQATETAAKKFGGQFRCVHFATHGTFNPDNPLKSGLMLSRDSENDGMLTVEELYDLTLNADLVILSACETALGMVTSGDDVVGFTRGLFYAGANSIVSSFWNVDDRATSILMQQFYENLKDSDKRAALRKAQLEVKNNYNSHPFFWAAFQLTGAVQ